MIEKLSVEKIFVIHYTKLKERKLRLDSSFKRYDIDVEYVLDYDKEELSGEVVDEYYDAAETLFSEKMCALYGVMHSPFRRLNQAEISCTIKHYLAIKKIAEECRDYGLVFEDDVLFVDNFPTRFNQCLRETPDDWGAIFMGCCACSKVPDAEMQPGQVAYQMSHPASRGGDSYLLKREVAEKIATTMKPFTFISDFELGYQLFQHGVKVYWWEPPLVVQGSESGLYSSELR